MFEIFVIYGVLTSHNIDLFIILSFLSGRNFETLGLRVFLFDAQHPYAHIYNFPDNQWFQR